VVKLCKNSDRPKQPAVGARFTRRTPGSKRFENQNLLLRYKRARIYSAQLGRFISRDPLGFVDGMSLYRAYFVPDAMDPTGTDRWVGSDENGNKIFWSGGFCYVRGSGGALVRVDCPGGQGPVEPGAVEAGATTVCVFITVDTCTPEPTDVVWPKWVCYAVAGAAAGAVFYCCRRVVVPCSFADCDGGFKPCGDILINKCQWDKTLGGMSICGCFP
jgi:RHS repeat-associated protein